MATTLRLVQMGDPHYDSSGQPAPISRHRKRIDASGISQHGTSIQRITMYSSSPQSSGLLPGVARGRRPVLTGTFNLMTIEYNPREIDIRAGKRKSQTRGHYRQSPCFQC
jgi:hypothetical protein